MRRTVVVLAVAALVHVPAAAAWSWPVDGPVLRPFVFGNDPYAAGQHRGIDIGASEGTSVRAATAGTVSFAGTVPNSGRTVTVQTAGGLSVTYLELGATGVTRGSDVAEGDQIGTIGSARHVHFGVRVTADPQGYLDPLLFLPARVTPATAAEPEPEPVAEPSPTVEPVPAPDPPLATEQPAAEPVPSEPEASPVSKPAAEVAAPPPVGEPASANKPAGEPASSETPVSEPDPVAEPSPVLEPVPMPEPAPAPDPSPTLVPVPLEPAASEPGVEPAAEPEAESVADAPATVDPPPAVELDPTEQGGAELDPIAEQSPAVEPAPVAGIVPPAAPSGAEARASVPEAEPAAPSQQTGAPVPVVVAAPVEHPVATTEPVAEPSAILSPVPVVHGAAAVALPAEAVQTLQEVRSAADSTPAVPLANPSVESAPAEQPSVEPARGGSVPAAGVSERDQGSGPVASSPVHAPPAVEATPQPTPATAAFVEPALAASALAAKVGVERPVPRMMERGNVPTVPEPPTASGSTRGASEPVGSTVVRIRPPEAVTAALPQKALKPVSSRPPRREPKSPGPPVATPAPRPTANGEIIDLLPAALAVLLALALFVGGTTAIPRVRRSTVTAEESFLVESVNCPLGRMRAPRSIHGCARVPALGFTPAVRPRRMSPARPLPRPRRRVPASGRA
jgi:hypothetical protein